MQPAATKARSLQHSPPLQKQVAQTQQLTRLESSRNNAQDELIAQKKQLNDLVEQRIALEKKLNTVANSANEKAQTANRNRLFGGEVSKAGNKLSPKQAEQAAKARVQGLNRQIEKLGRTVQSTEFKFDSLSQATSYWAGNERRRVMKAADAWDRYEKKVEAAAKKRQKIGNIRKGAGVGLGAAAFNIPGLGGIASGALGGAAVGGLAGGVAGGVTSGVVEATAALVAFSAEATKTAAEIQKLEIALKNITGDRFADALLIIRNVVEDFNVPLAEATSQFTKLAAAADNSGVSLADTNTVYRGLAAANKALGGDSERLQGILLATSQVFSKGKVQAEELRGQIGERLPGAFGLFAKSAGMSTQELDKALEQGQVSIQDFVRFAETLLDEYEADAAKIADAPIEAGERLKVAVDDLKRELGSDLTDIGASFQETGIVIAEETTSWIKAFKTINKDFEDFYNLIVPPTVQGFIDISDAIGTLFKTAIGGLPNFGLLISSLERLVQLKNLLNDRPNIVVPEYSGMEDISGDVIRPTAKDTKRIVTRMQPEDFKRQQTRGW